MTGREIIDAHHHLWDLEACRYPWLMARGVPRFFGDPTPIQKNYLVRDLRDDAGDYTLRASVHVQVGVTAGAELRETAWLQDSWRTHGLPTAIVAYCDLDDDAAAERLREQCEYSRVRGVRQIVGRSADEDAQTGSGALLDSPRWRENLGSLADFDLSFDLQLVPAQLERVAAIIADRPGLRVALCHAGSPWDRTPAGIASWRAGLQQLATLPDVYCKLSGFGMFEHDWTVASIRPLVETCIDVFGAARCMFGSNFPVDKLHASYARVWQAYEQICAPLSDAEQARLFTGTAEQFYRLDR